MSFQSIKSNRTITRLFTLSFLIAAFALLLSAQTAPAQCLESPTGETAVGLTNASSHFLVFYIDDLNKGGVPAGDRSVDFFVWPGEHTLRAEARIGDETVSVTRKVLIPVGYVCTWTVTDPTSAATALDARSYASFRRDVELLYEQKESKLIGSANQFALTRNRFSHLAVAAVAVRPLTSRGFAQETIKWTTQADFLRGKNGRQFTFSCPPNGTASGRLWGSGFYTDDSSICTAGLHAGVITLRDGGIVTIEIRPGIEAYASSSRNGITSLSYDFWPGSFVVIRERYNGPDRGSIARLLDRAKGLETFRRRATHGS